MDTSTHTPGTWHVAMHNEPQTYPAGAAYVAEVWAHDGEQPVAIATDSADASLIAAAPELLAALRLAQDILAGHAPHTVGDEHQIAAALAKAGA